MMIKVFVFFAKAFFMIAKIQLLWVYGLSIWLMFKSDAFFKMIFMMFVPIVSQIYLFISRWIEYGLWNDFNIYCILLLVEIAYSLMFVAIVHVIVKGSRIKFVSRIGLFGLIFLGIITLTWFCISIPTFRAKIRDQNVAELSNFAGVEFGATVNNSMPLIFENKLCCGYGFKPQNGCGFREYNTYSVLAEKKSKKIYEVFATKYFTDEKKADKEIATIKSLFTRKYNASFINTGNDLKAKVLIGEKRGFIITIHFSKNDKKYIVVVSVQDIVQARNYMRTVESYLEQTTGDPGGVNDPSEMMQIIRDALF